MDSYQDVVISSRIRLARNLSNYFFPTKLKTEHGSQIIEKVFSILNKFENYKVSELDNVILNSLKEKHLISEELVKNVETGALSLSHDETISIMINEEEHLREQCILQGLQLDKALLILNEVDDLLLEKLTIAYSSTLGFLTTCPSNIGTGLRASVMLFLPALTLTNTIEPIIETLAKVGLTVRGNYGENSGYDGFMFQISNSQTLGISEQQILSNVTTAVLKIIEKERKTRQELLSVKYDQLKDNVCRSYGILKYAYKLTEKEAIKLLSDIKFGVCLNLLEGIDIDLLNSLIEDIQPNTIQTICEDENENYDIFRAKYISSKI